MITMFILLLLGIGIISVIVSAAFRILRFVFSLPIIGTLAVIFILVLIFSSIL